MKSIKYSCQKLSEKEPFLGIYICLAEGIKNKRFTRETISRFFVQIMPKDEYDKYTKKDLINHLYILSNPIEDDKIGANLIDKQL
jgi:hypothetical protein